jgi:hypothetical protein
VHGFATAVSVPVAQGTAGASLLTSPESKQPDRRVLDTVIDEVALASALPRMSNLTLVSPPQSTAS